MAAQDCNTLAADCIVISCCCQCLILELIIFIFLKLPYKLVQTTRRYAKRKLARRKPDHNKINKAIMIVDQIITTPSLINLHPESEILEEEGFCCMEEVLDEEGFCCMEEVERVLEEMSQKGLFGFGSFWHGEELQEELTYFDLRRHYHGGASILVSVICSPGSFRGSRSEPICDT